MEKETLILEGLYHLDGKKKINSPEFVLPYKDIRHINSHKSVLFGNGIQLTMNDTDSFKLDISPKIYLKKIAEIVGKVSPDALN